jgi:hypothetical protein
MAEAAAATPPLDKIAAKPPDKATNKPPAGPAPLAESRWSLREFKDPGHWVCLERGTPYEAVFEPSFWANIATRAKFQPGQTVYIRNDEMTVFATLIVLDCGRNWAVMGEFERRSRAYLIKARPAPRVKPQFRVEFGGPMDKYRILRDGDNSLIKAGFDSEASAQTYLLEHQARLAG